MMMGGERGRMFREVDYSRPQTTAAQQVQALTSSTDAPQGQIQPTSSDTGGHWSEKLPEGVDASWVRRAIALIGRDKVGSFEDLADPEHRKWIRRKMRKAKAEQKKAVPPPAPEEEPGDGEETAPEPAPPPKPTESRIVRLSGRLPRGRMVDRPTPLAAPGGWVPADEGLWWPPYPTTGGPIARPELTASPTGRTDLDYVLNASGQKPTAEEQRASLEGYVTRA
jgi:hypothetical protein